MKIQILALVAALAGCCMAQVEPPAEPEEMVRLLPAPLPAALRRAVPRGEMSRFYGTAKPWGKELTFFVKSRRELDTKQSHFASALKSYPLRAKEFKELYFQGDRNGVWAGTLEIYQAAAAGKSKRRLHSIPFSYIGSELPDILVNVSATWLDTRQKKQPLLIVDFSHDNNFFGEQGGGVLFAFTRGLTAKPTIQVLGHGNDSNYSWSWGFDGVDDKGFLQLRAIRGSIESSHFDFLNWNGSGFTVARQLEKANTQN